MAKIFQRFAILVLKTHTLLSLKYISSQDHYQCKIFFNLYFFCCVLILFFNNFLFLYSNSQANLYKAVPSYNI